MGIISVLVALLLPATLRARGSARRVTCLNHLRQVTLAMILHTDQHDRFPAAGRFASNSSLQHHSWVTALLPFLEQASLANSYDLSLPYTDPKNFEITRTSISVLTCPDDVSLVSGEGNLSYVVNGGIGWTIPIDCPASVRVENDAVKISPLDLNGNGVTCPLETEPGPGLPDLVYLKSLSLFFVENWPLKTGTERFHRLRDVVDGTSTTLMVSENIRAGFDPDAQSSWGSPEPLRNMFFVSSSICPDRNCSRDEIDLSRANTRSVSPASQESLNSSLLQAEGTAPWPSSGHSGLVHFGWCDGHVSSISESIDGRVYFALTTPQGSQVRDLFEEPVLTGTEF